MTRRMTLAEAGHEPAPAKVNLTLHVTGRRADGYHLLDSLVVFTKAGDKLALHPHPGLHLCGPESADLSTGPDNLVLRAAALMGVFPPDDGAPDKAVSGSAVLDSSVLDSSVLDSSVSGWPAGLLLEKSLPVASGIGGGSADAAATLRLLARETARPLPDPRAILGLGADVPVCLTSRPCRMSGIGESLAPVPALPPLWLVLVNPRVHMATPDVFRALARKDNPPMPATFPHWQDFATFTDWLARQRNDLESPARLLSPVISQVLRNLAEMPGCALARMSGSGATCFGLFPDRTSADAAARSLALRQPGWWVCASGLFTPSDQLTRATT